MPATRYVAAGAAERYPKGKSRFLDQSSRPSAGHQPLAIKSSLVSLSSCLGRSSRSTNHLKRLNSMSIAIGRILGHKESPVELWAEIYLPCEEEQ